MELPHRVEKPWGHELWYAVTDRYVGKVLHIEPRQRLSLQYHERKDESSYVLSGRLLLIKGASADDLTTVEIGPGFTWRNLPGEVHTMEALEGRRCPGGLDPRGRRRRAAGGHVRPRDAPSAMT
jgi:mannose-6-phosphate isomerase